MDKPISKGQMARLQVLYSQLAAHTDQGTDRAARIAWASSLLCRSIASFKDLTQGDARHLIDTLQGQLGVKVPARPRRRMSRDAAHRAGTQGRRGDASNELTIASAADIARIQYVMGLIGWSQDQLDAWLRSSRSPLSNRASGTIRTLKDANRVYWALKGMAAAQGKWQKGRQG
jgi:hypothetical protein